MPPNVDVLISPSNVLRRQGVGFLLEMGAAPLLRSGTPLSELTSDMCVEGMKSCQKVICVDGRDVTTTVSEMSLFVHPFNSDSCHSSSNQTLAGHHELTTSFGHPSRVGLGHFIHSIDEMECDTLMTWGGTAVLDEAWSRCDRLPHLWCRSCQMLHHSCDCSEPDDTHVWLPRSTVVVDALSSCSGYRIKYNIE